MKKNKMKISYESESDVLRIEIRKGNFMILWKWVISLFI